jgi:KipI family sensor histidine kinase inhibitor
VGDTALTIEFGDRVDRRLNDWVLALAKCLHEAKIDGVSECVPTFRSLMVHYDPLAIPYAALTARIGKLIQGLRTDTTAGRLWRLPACYDPDIAPDLADVAQRANLSTAQLIERHSALTYHVYMLGFLPGQAYMGDVVRELAFPRREAPRMKIPAGSLAIAGTMTCIFPQETPCGWHLIGRSPIALWNWKNGSSPLLCCGDKVRFEPVSLREYEVLKAQAAEDRLSISPTDGREAAAA